MKKNKFFLTAILSAITLSASAQFVNSNSSSSSTALRPSSVNSITENYSRLNILPIFSQANVSGNGVNMTLDDLMYGIGIGYLFGINITGHNIPLFLEIGPEINYTCRYDEGDKSVEDTFTQMITIGTPINVAYKIGLSDAISLAPFAGLNAKINVLSAVYQDGETYDTFDNVDANRFQLGWNVGIGCYFNRFYLGYRYYSDITPFWKENGVKATIDNNYINFGIKF